MNTNLIRAACVLAGLSSAVTAQGAWTQVAQNGGGSYLGSAMAYDSQRGRTVAFGGKASNITMFSTTWEWDGTTWTQAATTGPTARADHSMAYDSQRGRTVLFGGGYTVNAGRPLAAIGDTWEWDGTTWSQVASTGPAARYSYGMAFDSQRGRTVLFGGCYVTWPNPSPLGVMTILDDTWEWDGTAWTQVASTGPSARYGQAMAYDRLRGRTVLFGGSAGAGETWEWNGTSWTLMGTTGPAGGTLAFDSQRGKTVLLTSAANTWEWDGTSWTQLAIPGPARSGPMVHDSQRGRLVMCEAWDDWATQHPTWELLTDATASAYGAGCGNPALSLSPMTNARPVVNTTARASLSNIPSSLAFVALGWSRTTFGSLPLPLAMTGYGLPGCYLLQSAQEAAQPVTPTGPGTATYSLQLPNWGGLIGLHIYLQGWANAPGANPGNAIVSNGIEWIVGNV